MIPFTADQFPGVFAFEPPAMEVTKQRPRDQSNIAVIKELRYPDDPDRLFKIDWMVVGF